MKKEQTETNIPQMGGERAFSFPFLTGGVRGQGANKE